MQVPKNRTTKPQFSDPSFCFQAIYQTKLVCLVSREVLISHFTSRKTRHKKCSNFQKIIQKVYIWTINLKTINLINGQISVASCTEGTRSRETRLGGFSLPSPIALRPLTASLKDELQNLKMVLKLFLVQKGQRHCHRKSQVSPGPWLPPGL